MYLLMVPEPPTFRGSPWYEVPTRPHTVWCGSPIRYDGPVAIILKICLSSCLSAHESGLLYLRVVRFTCLVISSVIGVNGSFTVEGEGGSESQVRWEEAPTLLGTHNTTGRAQLPEEQSTRMWQPQHTRKDNMYNTQQMSPHECNSCYRKFYVKGLSNVREGSHHRQDNINNIYNTFSLIDNVLQQMKWFKRETQVKETCITSV